MKRFTLILMSVCFICPPLVYAQSNFQLITAPAWFNVAEAKIFVGGHSTEDSYAFDIEDTFTQLHTGNGKMVCGPIIDDVGSSVKAMYCAEPAIIVSAKQALDAQRRTITTAKGNELVEPRNETYKDERGGEKPSVPDRPIAGF